MVECEAGVELVREILQEERLTIVFQPIFDSLNGTVMGYEALTRGPKDHSLHSPVQLFDTAESVGLLSELELLCRKLAIKRFAELQLVGNLFLNVSPYTIGQNSHPHGETLNLVKYYGLKPNKIVIEVTEKFEAEDPSLLKESLEHYRSFGFKIAIDDLGTGHSGLRQWAELRPDIVKIDRYFISGCQHNIVKRELLRTIFELGRATDVEIIAEGIEESDEFLMLSNLGMKYAQGYLLAMPAINPITEFPKTYLTIKSHSSEQNPSNEFGDFEISNLVQSVAPVRTHVTCLEVYKTFKKSSNLHSLAVVDESEKLIGIVYRDQLAELFSSDYGHALYDKKPVTKIMREITFKVDIAASLDDVSAEITDNEEFDQRPDFVVVSGDKYLGLASVRSLLKKMTEEKVKHAQHANPLTMLPGNIVINERMNHLLLHRQPFLMAYFDLDFFKPFNDVYGYAAGDEIIKLVAEVLSQHCNGEFIGHVGGDDFVVIFSNQLNALAVCKQVLVEFEQRVRNYFEPEHIADNGYTATARDGSKLFFPLLSLSCGVIEPNLINTNSHHDVALLAASAKKQAKTLKNGEVFYLAS